MATKITVNGVTYDSVEAMPPDVRRLYDETLAKFPDLADHDGDGVPEIVQGRIGPLDFKTTIRKRFIVNGTTYEDEASMPPEARQAYEQAIRTARLGEPTVKKNEIKLSFDITGPGFTFRKTLGGSSPRPGPDPAASAPIEPAAARGGLLLVVLLGACVAAGLAYWFLASAR